jgi:site-specific recombinase XerD
LSQIGELLGHRHPDTTRIYAKVDIKALRQLALPWPGAMP